MDITIRPAVEADVPFISFRVADEKTNPDFERAVGCPGIRRLLR